MARKIGIIFSLFLLASCQYAPTNSRDIQPERSASVGAKALTLQGKKYQALKAQGKSVSGAKWMISAAHPLAVEAGAEVLRKGGTAADAAIATQAMLGLVEPQSSGLGGGGFIVWYDAVSGKVTTLDGRETSPALATEQLFMQPNGKPIAFFDAVVGGKAVGVPSMVRLMEAAHSRWGSVSFDVLFEGAIKTAENGFKVSKRLAALIDYDKKRLSSNAVAADYFMPNGNPLKAGEILRNPLYANTLKNIVRYSADSFYEGVLASDIVDAVTRHANAGVLSLGDMRSYNVIERTPLCSNYHIYTVCGMAPPSSGGVVINQALSMLEPYKLSEMNAQNPQAWRLIGDAMRLAFADRGCYIADPEKQVIPLGKLLDRSYLKNRSLLLQGDKPLQNVRAGEFGVVAVEGRIFELPSTSHMSIMDSYGNALSMTSSIENAFGSRVMVGGFLLNNQLTDFAFNPEKDGRRVLNRVEGGKRPMSSMSPTIVLKEGRPVLITGSPGGSRIIGYVLQSLIASLDWGMSPQEVADMPRLVNRYDIYDVEDDAALDVLSNELESVGYEVKRKPLTSGMHIISVSEEVLLGGADPRREGIVIAE